MSPFLNMVCGSNDRERGTGGKKIFCALVTLTRKKMKGNILHLVFP